MAAAAAAEQLQHADGLVQSGKSLEGPRPVRKELGRASAAWSRAGQCSESDGRDSAKATKTRAVWRCCKHSTTTTADADSGRDATRRGGWLSTDWRARTSQDSDSAGASPGASRPHGGSRGPTLSHPPGRAICFWPPTAGELEPTATARPVNAHARYVCFDP